MVFVALTQMAKAQISDRVPAGTIPDTTDTAAGQVYENNEKLPPAQGSDVIFTSVDQPAHVKRPEYLAQFNELSANLRSEIRSYKPADSSRLHTVEVSFVVEKDGSVSNLTVLNATSQKMEREISKAISSTFKWTPAQQDGQTVRSWTRLKWDCPTAYSYTSKNQSSRSSANAFRPDNYSSYSGGQYKVYRRGVEASDLNLSSAGNSNYYYSNEYGQWSAIFNPYTGKYDTYQRVGTGAPF